MSAPTVRLLLAGVLSLLGPLAGPWGPGAAPAFGAARAAAAARNWRWVGENVGFGPEVRTVQEAFMRSAGHRANMLDRDYAQTGVGVARRDGRVWVVQVFRRPAWWSPGGQRLPPRAAPASRGDAEARAR